MPVDVQLETLTYCGKEPGSVGEIIKRGVFNAGDLAELGITVREDVVVREKMYLSSMAENITAKRDGCGEKTNSGTLILREKFLDVTNLQIWDQICAEEFGGTFFELARKKGFDVNNLEGTDIQTLLNELYANIWKRDMLSIAQFGDTAIVAGAVVVNPGAAGTALQKSAYAAYRQRVTLSTMNGFWKLVFGGVAAKAIDAADPDGIIRSVVIDQVAALPANYTRDTLLPSLYNGQSELMYQVDDADKRFVLSRELFQNLQTSLQTFATTGEAANGYFMTGTGQITYNGIQIIQNKLIAQKALTPYAGGNPATFKRRAYLIVDGGFQVGTDTIQDAQVMKTWFSPDLDLNNIQIRYKLGEQYVDGDVIVVAY